MRQQQEVDVPRYTRKVATLTEAAHLIRDGQRVAFGGMAIHGHPMALIRELVRQGRKDLTVVGTINGDDIDLLAGAGCLRTVETSYVGLEQFGLARNYRRRVEAGQLTVVDYTDVLAFERFHASQHNWSFWPATHLGGTDLLARNPAIKEFIDPISGERYFAVPAAKPDVVVIHAPVADEYGNVLVFDPAHRMIPQSMDVTMTRATDTIIVTVEKVVSHEEIKRHPGLNQVPRYRTTCVVETPFGAHPGSMLGFYDLDVRHFEEYTAASESDEAFRAYLDRYVRDTPDHLAYLERIGVGRLMELRRVAVS